MRCLRTFSQQYWRMEMHCLSKIIAQRSIQSMAGAKEKQTQPRRSATLQRVFGDMHTARGLATLQTWRMVPQVTASSGKKSRKKPKGDSRRPRDIDVVTWGRCGQRAKYRELECRAKEARGEGPPSISPEILGRLPNEQKERVLEQIGAQRKSLSNS